MTKVTLTAEEKQGDKLVVTTEDFEIRKIKLKQFTQTLSHVKDIMKALGEDDNLKSLITQATGGGPELYDAEGMTEAQVEELMKKADTDFILKAIGAFEQVAVILPDHAIALLATLSGIDKAKLEEQDLEVVLDIMDAVLVVNDIEALIQRVKKSFGQTIGKLKFLQVRKEVTQA
jgi:hypothetical protein